MALSVNTGHALASNLVSLILVDDDGVLKDIQRPSATFTIGGACTYGSGTYGRHLRTAVGTSNNAVGATVSPVVPLGTIAKPNGTIFVAVNSVGSRFATRGPLVVQQASITNTVGVAVDAAGGLVHGMAGTAQVAAATTASVASGSHSIALTRTGQTSHQIYVDGVLDLSTGGQVGNNHVNAGYDTLGGWTTGGFGYAVGDFVIVAAFDRVLTSVEIADLHASLTGANAFALVAAAASSVTVNTALDTLLFSGTVGVSPISGRIISEPITNNTGSLYINDTGISVWVNHPTTNALVVAFTGQSTNSSGILTTTADSDLVVGQEYRVRVRMSDGAEAFATSVAVA